MRFVALLLVLLAPMRASAFMGDTSPSGGMARPVNPCQIRGEHFAGVVSVDMKNGTMGEVVLTDVRAVVEMAPSLTDVVVYVQSPFSFYGTFAPHDLGGPPAYARQSFRANGVTLLPNVPFEISLSRMGNTANVRVPAPYGGALELFIPCNVLSAGSPRARMSPPRERLGRTFVAIDANAVLTSAPGREGTHIARVVGNGPGRVVFAASVTPAANGFMRITMASKIARLEGYVHQSFVEVLTPRAAPPGALAPGFAFPMRPASAGMRTETFHFGTRLFADATVAQPWASVTRVLRAGYIPGAPRGTFVLGAIDLPVLACRHDGVMARPSCGAPRGTPPIGIRACTGTTCVERGYIPPL